MRLKGEQLPQLKSLAHCMPSSYCGDTCWTWGMCCGASSRLQHHRIRNGWRTWRRPQKWPKSSQTRRLVFMQHRWNGLPQIPGPSPNHYSFIYSFIYSPPTATATKSLYNNLQGAELKGNDSNSKGTWTCFCRHVRTQLNCFCLRLRLSISFDVANQYFCTTPIFCHSGNTCGRRRTWRCRTHPGLRPSLPCASALDPRLVFRAKDECVPLPSDFLTDGPSKDLQSTDFKSLDR